MENIKKIVKILVTHYVLSLVVVNLCARLGASIAGVEYNILRTSLFMTGVYLVFTAAALIKSLWD